MSENEYRAFWKTGRFSGTCSIHGWLVQCAPFAWPASDVRHLSDYPVQAINWHDRTALPGLSEAEKLFHGALMGGN